MGRFIIVQRWYQKLLFVCWLTLFLCWLTLLCCLTLMSRGFTGRSRIVLFQSFIRFVGTIARNAQKVNFSFWCHRELFRSIESFLESHFTLLWYKTLHSEVPWTEENTGKSEFTLFVTWLIALHTAVLCQNTIQISITKWAKQELSFHLVCVPSELRKAFSCLTFTWPRSHDHTTDQSYHLQYTVPLFYSSLRLNATCDSQHSPLLNKWRVHKELANPSTYLNITSSNIRILRRSYLIIILRGAIAIVLTWIQQAIIL